MAAVWTSLPDGGRITHRGGLVLQVVPGGWGWKWQVAWAPGGGMRCPVVSQGVCPERMMAQLAATKEAERLLSEGSGG